MRDDHFLQAPPVRRKWGAGAAKGACTGGDLPTGVDPRAQRAFNELSQQIHRLIGQVDAPTLLKRVFCQTLDREYVNQPVPTDALPVPMRTDTSDVNIVAPHG